MEFSYIGMDQLVETLLYRFIAFTVAATPLLSEAEMSAILGPKTVAKKKTFDVIFVIKNTLFDIIKVQ